MFFLGLEMGSGDLTKAIKKAKEIAEILDVGVTFTFNGVLIIIFADSDVDEQVHWYEEKLHGRIK